MYNVSLLDGNNGDVLYTIKIPIIPRNGEHITIESSSIKEGFVTYKVDSVHYIYDEFDERFRVVIYVIKSL